MYKKLFALVLTVLFMSSCGEPAKSVDIQPVGNEMKYVQTEFTVKTGQQVNLTFTNTATSAAMVHNVVILKKGTDVDAFAQQALAAGPDKGYIPASDAIIAHTELSKPGESHSVSFTAPTEPGDYKYICTYPGHYVTMHGVMKVVAR